MDITTILGIAIGFVVVVIGILQDGQIATFIDPASIAIVIGGTFSAVIASFPLSMLKNVGKHFSKLIKGKAFLPEPVIETLVEFAQIARKNGLLALEEQANTLEDPFFKQGVMLVVDAVEADKVREMLETEVANMDKRHGDEIAIYDKLAAFAPAFGMIGTLIGLINMLEAMGDLSSDASSSLGASMSVALVTTLYGCLLANLIFAPIAKKLKIRNEEEILYKSIIIEGVIGIQAGENPKNLKEKLALQLHQKKKDKIMGEEGGGEGGDKPKKEKKSKK